MNTDMTVIAVDIIDKTHAGGWRIIGICPTTVTPSGGLHLYAGPHARAVDSTTDEVITTGRSLADLLQRLADSTGYPVTCHDEITDQERHFHPGRDRS